jgi:SAM-dependent methyltransferase
MDHVAKQLQYFASIDHAQRFVWQTEDPFVRAQEHETLKPLVERLRALRASLGRPLRVFESGCGEGVNMIHLRQLGLTEDDAMFSGVDLSPEAVTEAGRHGLDVQVGNGLELPVESASFDVSFCRDVFHHLENDEDRKRFFSELHRIVRPGGFVAAIEPNPFNPMILALSLTVPEEKGLRSISELRMREMFPEAEVIRTAPSASWRFWLHFHSPLRRIAWIAKLLRWELSLWESCSRLILPSAFWSYRVYTWKKK